MSSAVRTQAACLESAMALADTFEVYRVRSQEWHDAKPEMLHRCGDLNEALAYGAAAVQPKQAFFVRQIDRLTGWSVDRFYMVKQTSKHTMARVAYDGPYTVREKGRVCEFLFATATHSREEWRKRGVQS